MKSIQNPDQEVGEMRYTFLKQVNDYGEGNLRKSFPQEANNLLVLQ